MPDSIKSGTSVPVEGVRFSSRFCCNFRVVAPTACRIPATKKFASNAFRVSAVAFTHPCDLRTDMSGTLHYDEPTKAFPSQIFFDVCPWIIFLVGSAPTRCPPPRHQPTSSDESSISTRTSALAQSTVAGLYEIQNRKISKRLSDEVFFVIRFVRSTHSLTPLTKTRSGLTMYGIRFRRVLPTQSEAKNGCELLGFL